MITLNLLPPKEKEELGLARISRLIVFCSGVILALAMIFIILLLNIWLFLSVQLRALDKLMSAEKQSSSFKTIEKLEAEITSFNQNLKVIDTIQNSSKKYSAILEDLAGLAPPGIEFYNFFFDAKTGRATLDGHSLNRDDFLSFQNALEKYPKFSQIDSPLANLIRSTDNNFRISFMINY